MLSLTWLACALVPLAPLVVARPPVGLLAPPKQPPFGFEGSQAAARLATAPPVPNFFDQLLDHSNPSFGTFPQRFWFYDGYYEEGGPIVLFNAGEEDASGYTGYLQNGTIVGSIAYATGGATIVLEHRYWGASIPFADYSTANMKYFTIENSVQDFAYFAQNVVLPFSNGTNTTMAPPNVPWIVTGGSYPGALAAYVKQTFPDLFYAAYASSAPVQAISDFYGYFIPVANGAPQNCSTDMKAVITHWDSVMSNGTKEEQLELMSVFGLQNVTHSVDAASALQTVPWSWQNLGPAVGAHQEFFDFCDTLEVKDGVAAGPEGYGLEYALAQWGAWQLATNQQSCGDAFAGDSCWGTFDPDASFYTNVDPSNTYRPWMWLICTDLGFWQNGDPTAPSIVSKQVTVEYWERQCPLWFPAEDGVSVPQLAPVAHVNKLYDGWNINQDHLLFVNGEFDPWRSGSVSSELPSAPKRQSTPQQPILLVKTGVHCWDMITSTAQANPNTRVVFDQVVAQMVEWMKEWNMVPARPPQN
ncbi:serine carboxypeptidase S28-domain-containing protein [Mycena rosella]|uniref:Serine carboxypeptidase S28-domain-containing protein n=1 Tax=Mycena rosella TaxID=1033263 RepID=A0AAD7G8M0_MYCRO|nr:serine carboxypeptidase S28-domain-containing protein [Mycena rosella]